MPDWTTITLVIKEVRNGDTFSSHLYVEEEPVATNRTLSSEATQTQRELSAGYLSWFDQPQLPLVEEETLRAIGTQLFEAWLADDWGDVEDELSPTDHRRFVVASDVPAVLNLPWCLLWLPGEDKPIGLDPRSSVRLHPATERLAEGHDERRPGPLRVLYSACAPRDAVELGYEKEEYQLLQTLSQRDRVAHFGCDLGAFDELQDRVREYRPHVVHLTGHGVVDDGEPYFAFEDEEGYADTRAGHQIVDDALAGRGVQCVFVSGCETAQAPEMEAINGLCQSLVTSGVPLAVGWAASILDDVATAFGNTFYAELSAGESVDRAVVQARRDARNLCRGRTEEDGVTDPSWTLPVLYTATTQTDLFDPDQHEDPPKPSVEQNPLPGMTEGNADYFIGRRREQQQLLPALRSGDLNTVLLTGLGGVGKSTLATRLARALQKDDFVPIAVPSTDDDPLTAGRLLDRCCGVFSDEGLDDSYQRLRSEEIELRDKLRLLVRLLNRNRFTLVLDNFEQNMDRETREILNDELAWFLPHLFENLTGSSRCLVTSRYRPADLGDDLPPVTTERSLKDFPESAFFKYVMDDDDVRRRYRSGDLPRKLLSRIYELLGGTPRFLKQVREVLRDMPADELKSALDSIDLPEDAEESHLQQLRDDYVRDLFVDQLYGDIEPPEAREALSRAAVYTIPMTAEGYAAAADAGEADIKDWLDAWRRRTFVAPVRTDDSDPERWIIPTLLRPWLLDRIDADERQEAHQAAGEWLVDVREVGHEERILDEHFLEVELEARSRFLDAGNHERARQITNHVSAIFIKRDFYDEVIRLNKEVLKPEWHPEPKVWLGRVHLQRGSYERARSEFEQVVEAGSEIPDRKVKLTAQHNLASVALRQGRYGEAQDGFENMLEIAQEIGDRRRKASALHQMARIALHQGKYGEAQEGFEKALEVAQNIGDQWETEFEAKVRQNLATVALEQGRYEEAREGFEEVLQTYQDMNNRSGEATMRHELARTARKQGKYEEAHRGFDEALKIFQRIGGRAWEATTRHELARTALEQGKYGKARKGFEKALEIAKEIRDQKREAQIRHELALIMAKQDEYDQARDEFERSLEIEQKIGDRAGKATTRHNLASIALEQGKYEEAQAEFLKVLRIYQEIGVQAKEAKTLAQLGIMAAGKLGRKKRGLRLLYLSKTILNSIGYAQAQQVDASIQVLVDNLGYDEDEWQKEVEYAQQSYAGDRGWSLIQEAFPDADIPNDVPTPEDSE